MAEESINKKIPYCKKFVFFPWQQDLNPRSKKYYQDLTL